MATVESSDDRLPLMGWSAWTAKLDRLSKRQRRAVLVGAIGALVMIPLLAMGRSPAHPVALVAPVTGALPGRAVPVVAAAAPPATASPAPAALAAEPAFAVPGVAPAEAASSGPVSPAASLPATAGDYNKSKFGFLTVHSTVAYSFVYVQMLRYGRVEQRLIVPCGKRFVSVGIPNFYKHEPTWLAPSQNVDIPCGESAEVTIQPRKVR